PRSRRNAPSSFRSSDGNPAIAGVIFSWASNARVDSKPSLMAPAVATSTPGNPTLAARRANSGQGTRPATSVLFNDRYMKMRSGCKSLRFHATSLLSTCCRRSIWFSLYGSRLVIPVCFNPRPLRAAHRFHAYQLRISRGELVQMRHDLAHCAGDVFHVLLLPEQEKLRQPHGFLVRGALRHRAAAVIVMDRLRAASFQLRKVVRIHPEQIAAINGFIKPPIARDTLAVERRHKQIARNLAVTETEDIVVDRFTRESRLRRGRVDAGDLRQPPAQDRSVADATRRQFWQLLELAQQNGRLKFGDAVVRSN